MKEEFPEIIRAKGFFWSDNHPQKAGFLSMAANILRMDNSSQWSESDGDKRQEIVFIGIDLDTAHMQTVLDGCLTE